MANKEVKALAIDVVVDDDRNSNRRPSVLAAAEYVPKDPTLNSDAAALRPGQVSASGAR